MFFSFEYTEFVEANGLRSLCVLSLFGCFVYAYAYIHHIARVYYNQINCENKQINIFIL